MVGKAIIALMLPVLNVFINFPSEIWMDTINTNDRRWSREHPKNFVKAFRLVVESWAACSTYDIVHLCTLVILTKSGSKSD